MSRVLALLALVVFAAVLCGVTFDVDQFRLLAFAGVLGIVSQLVE